MFNKLLLLITLSSLAVSCANYNKKATLSSDEGLKSQAAVKIPVEPEHLINLSQEVVTFSLANITEMVNWVSNFKPSRIHLNCAKDSNACRDAQLQLKKMGVKYHHIASNKNNVNLIYEKTLARDCTKENLTYRDKQAGYIFGCANATNMVRMVKDHQQFIKPAKLAPSDGDTTKYNQILTK
jgi:type IV pilus biogenesis protein CpaD/CtpE